MLTATRCARAGAFVLCFALPLAGPVHASADGPVKTFADDIRDGLSTLKAALRDLDGVFVDDLKALGDQVQNGSSTAAEAHDALFLQLARLHADIAHELLSFTDAVEASGSAQLELIDLFPNPFVVGDAGLVDDGKRRGALLTARSLRFVGKRVRAFSARLQKTERYDLVIDRRMPLLPPMTPTGEGSPAPAPAVPLRIDLAVAGSDRLQLGDGTIQLGGTADAGAGDVSVSVQLPGAPALEIVVPVDQDGRWSARFPAAGEGDLAEGNYAVSARQGDVVMSDSIGVQ